MSRASTLILLGVLGILAPFSGLPLGVRNFFAVIFGAAVLGIGLALRVRDVHEAHEAKVETPPVVPETESTLPSSVSPI